MHILHVTQNYYPSRGGTQHTMQHVSEYLAQKYNDEVAVYTTNSYYGPNRKNFRKIPLQQEVVNGVQVKRFPFIKIHKPLIRYYSRIKSRVFRGEAGDFLTALNAGPLSPSLRNAMLHTGADVICASSMHYLFADYPSWGNGANSNKPFVLYGALHVKEGEEVSAQYLKRISQADYYIANTGFEKEYLVARGINAAKIKVTGAATDVFEYALQLSEIETIKHKYHLDEGSKVILCLCRHEASKNIEWLLQAYKLLRQQGQHVYLLLAGARGGLTDSLLALAEKDPHIRVLFDFSDKEKCELLKLADMVVLPSVSESFGVVFLEGWSYHKPVIGANIGAIASVIDDGINGLLFKPGDMEDLSEKVKTLLTNNQLCNAFGNNGYQKVMRLYTWPIVSSAFRSVYELAIQSKKGVTV
ncbi:glycosyltransferase family 4 protein [Foetidibacter luteolus]|uniref:glycosyltransferase family 4 protein n=1 Tax=Foetidibacter luteolus TaxID=2608880 RepID=UPI001A99C4C3|nr:glycosyltransferase family 4 protein [Foetidibacter luteolus]